MRVDDPERIPGVKGSRIQVKCLKIIKKAKLSDLQRDVGEVEIIMKSLIKSLKYIHLNTWILESWDPIK